MKRAALIFLGFALSGFWGIQGARAWGDSGYGEGCCDGAVDRVQQEFSAEKGAEFERIRALLQRASDEQLIRYKLLDPCEEMQCMLLETDELRGLADILIAGRIDAAQRRLTEESNRIAAWTMAFTALATILALFSAVGSGWAVLKIRILTRRERTIPDRIPA